jgi:small-conductance mechanosensitive channel
VQGPIELLAITLTMPDGTQLQLDNALETGAAVLAILVAGALLIILTHWFVRGLARALMTRERPVGMASSLSATEIKRRQDTIEALGVDVVRFFVVVAAGLMILETVFKLDIGPAIAGLGVAGIAVGLGTQSLVRDYVNGALILLENQFAIGDVVKVAGIGGVVEDFTLRRTMLRDLDGTLHTVPNSQITISSNLTRSWARINETIPVVYGTDVEHARQVIDRVGEEMAAEPDFAADILEPPHVERIQELQERGIVLLVLGKVQAAAQWSVAGELRSRVLRALEENGIAMPRL